VASTSGFKTPAASNKRDRDEKESVDDSSRQLKAQKPSLAFSELETAKLLLVERRDHLATQQLEIARMEIELKTKALKAESELALERLNKEYELKDKDRCDRNAELQRQFEVSLFQETAAQKERLDRNVALERERADKNAALERERTDKNAALERERTDKNAALERSQMARLAAINHERETLELEKAQIQLRRDKLAAKCESDIQDTRESERQGKLQKREYIREDRRYLEDMKESHFSRELISFQHQHQISYFSGGSVTAIGGGQGRIALPPLAEHALNSSHGFSSSNDVYQETQRSPAEVELEELDRQEKEVADRLAALRAQSTDV
jgi:hypothetical protein